MRISAIGAVCSVKVLIRKLQGNIAIQSDISRAIDLAHAAGANCGHDFIWANARTR